MKIIIKKDAQVFALSLDKTDLQAILLTTALVFNPGLPSLPMHDFVAGTGGLAQAWALISSFIG